MDRVISVIVIAAVFAIVLILMIVAWRRRLHRDTALRPDPVAAAARGELLHAVDDAMYVATTEHDEPLRRLVIDSLAYRGSARLAVHEGGVAIRVRGEDEVFLRADALIGAGRATWAIDRVVEKDGLIFIAWRADEDTAADSYLRIIDPQHVRRVIDAITALVAAPATTDDSEEHRG